MQYEDGPVQKAAALFHDDSHASTRPQNTDSCQATRILKG